MWFEPVEEGAEAFMWKWHTDEEEASAERHRIAATPTATVGAHARAQNGRKDEEGRKADEGE